MSVRKHLDSADLSDLGAKEVEAMFDEAQKKAMEAVGGVVPKKMRPTSERDLPTGVFKTASGKFRSSISWRGKKSWIGTFDTLEQASAAHMSAKAALKDANPSSLHSAD